MKQLGKHLPTRGSKYMKYIVHTCLFLAVCSLTASISADCKGTASVNLKRERREGQMLFKANGCFDCHSINGQGSTEGVSLSSVGLRRNRKFLEEQLKDPEEHVKKNSKAFNGAPNLMTNPNLTPKEIKVIVT